MLRNVTNLLLYNLYVNLDLYTLCTLKIMLLTHLDSSKHESISESGYVSYGYQWLVNLYSANRQSGNGLKSFTVIVPFSQATLRSDSMSIAIDQAKMLDRS